jgi:hypothetical protein
MKNKAQEILSEWAESVSAPQWFVDAVCEAALYTCRDATLCDFINGADEYILDDRTNEADPIWDTDALELLEHEDTAGVWDLAIENLDDDDLGRLMRESGPVGGPASVVRAGFFWLFRDCLESQLERIVKELSEISAEFGRLAGEWHGTLNELVEACENLEVAPA